MTNAEWLEANQRVLVAEFARLKAHLAGEEGAKEERELASARGAMQSPPAIDLISSAFTLSSFERDVLLLCAGVEMDRALARRCSLFNENRAQPVATFTICMAKLAGAHWSALSPIAPLRRWRLIEVRDTRAAHHEQHLSRRASASLPGRSQLPRSPAKTSLTGA